MLAFTGHENRIYLGRDGETLILLTGGTKQRQQRDIERAKELWADYKAAKAAEARDGNDARI